MLAIMDVSAIIENRKQKNGNQQPGSTYSKETVQNEWTESQLNKLMKKVVDRIKKRAYNYDINKTFERE